MMFIFYPQAAIKNDLLILFQYDFDYFNMLLIYLILKFKMKSSSGTYK